MIGRIEWTTNTDVLITDIDTNNIAELNLTTCEIDKVYALPEGLVTYPKDATISSDGFIAFSRVSSIVGDTTSSPGSIVIFKDKQLIHVIEDATHPVWSFSGNSLAYVGIDGIYVTSFPKFKAERLIPYNSLYPYNRWLPFLPVPEWSPSGDKLVYHRLASDCVVPDFFDISYIKDWCQYNIYMYDLASHQETLLVKGGLMPYWIPE